MGGMIESFSLDGHSPPAVPGTGSGWGYSQGGLLGEADRLPNISFHDLILIPLRAYCTATNFQVIQISS